MIDTDTRFMRHALALARRNLGQTWPNPAVGALVVKDGITLGIGWTARGGRPHAEPQALTQAGEEARGATLYVTLEPCAHHGQTPPCTESIIKAGIARVVIACADPHPQVNGKGVAALRAAHIDVIQGVCSTEAQALNAGFFSVVQRGRPYVALKMAMSSDGKIAGPGGTRQQITGETARAYTHLLRSEYDAIMTGIGTVLADDPLLNCRLPGLSSRSPVRVVMDRRQRLPKDCNLLKTQDQAPVWSFASPLPETLAELAARGITQLLVEAGNTLSSAFLHDNLVDRLYWFRAPIVIGNEGLGAPDMPKAMQRFRVVESLRLGEDTLEIMECSPAS